MFCNSQNTCAFCSTREVNGPVVPFCDDRATADAIGKPIGTPPGQCFNVCRVGSGDVDVSCAFASIQLGLGVVGFVAKRLCGGDEEPSDKLKLPYLKNTASTQSRRGLFKRMISSSFEEEPTTPHLEPESMDAEPEIMEAPASQNPVPSNLNSGNAAIAQSCRRLFQSKSWRSSVQTQTASSPTSRKQMSPCSLRCIIEKSRTHQRQSHRVDQVTTSPI